MVQIAFLPIQMAPISHLDFQALILWNSSEILAYRNCSFAFQYQRVVFSSLEHLDLEWDDSAEDDVLDSSKDLFEAAYKCLSACRLLDGILLEKYNFPKDSMQRLQKLTHSYLPISADAIMIPMPSHYCIRRHLQRCRQRVEDFLQYFALLLDQRIEYNTPCCRFLTYSYSLDNEEFVV